MFYRFCWCCHLNFQSDTSTSNHFELFKMMHIHFFTVNVPSGATPRKGVAPAVAGHDVEPRGPSKASGPPLRCEGGGPEQPRTGTLFHREAVQSSLSITALIFTLSNVVLCARNSCHNPRNFHQCSKSTSKQRPTKHFPANFPDRCHFHVPSRALLAIFPAAA